MNSDFGFVDLLGSGSAEYGTGCESFDNASYTVPSGGGRGAGGGGGGDDQDNDDAERGQRRLPWTEADNLRLISARLHNSVDPIDGNRKKGEFYWKKVTKEYNENNPVDRRRKPIHCKDHWVR
ncbi:hypothetical protein BRADI_1g49784v3 [Brachypodium distachyon]|uniref:Myb-like domain-containing protein n=1 Tax=Brachypodium distachyon TaxID=15368 RepID=A0A0Q3JPM0_BRADI|nr:hypothetical protein BRADI_1g49784v3 [Brachypodium distachyon]